MALWDLHHLRRLDDTGFMDGLYGRRNAPPPGHEHAHDHAHDHARDHDHAPSKDTEAKITASGAVVSPDCDDHCT
jgi:hypothetical protein